MIQGKVLVCGLDDHGSIKVTTEYTLTDGSKKTEHTRYNWLNFSKEKVLLDVETHCKTLMFRLYTLKRNNELKTTDLSAILYKCTSMVVITKPEIKNDAGVITQSQETITIDDK